MINKNKNGISSTSDINEEQRTREKKLKKDKRKQNEETWLSDVLEDLENDDIILDQRLLHQLKK